MKNNILFILLIGLISIFSCQKVDFNQEQRASFVKFYGSQYHNSANDVLEINNEYYLVGFSNQTENQKAGLLIKTNDFGNAQWETYLPPTSGEIELNGIVVGNDNNLVVCGKYTDTTGSSDIIVAKFTPDGILLWQNIFGGIENQQANQIVRANDGGYILVGTTTLANAGNTNPTGEFDVFVAKIDELGDSIASNQFGGFDRDIGSDLMSYQGNKYLIVGTTESFDGITPNHENKLVYMLVLSNQLNEDNVMTHGDNQNQTGNSISIDNNGNLLISGSYETIGGSKQGMVYNLDFTDIGNVLNVGNYSSNGNEEFFDVQQQANGTLCATGITTNADATDKICVFEINPDFTEADKYDLGFNGAAFGRNLIAPSNGGFLIAAASLWATNQKAVLIKVDENVEL